MPLYKPHGPRDVDEVVDLLDVMMVASPRFIDSTDYLHRQNIDTAFLELNDGLQVIRTELGETLYLKLREMSDRMRAYFEADPEDKTGETPKGRAIIREMMDMLKPSAGKS